MSNSRGADALASPDTGETCAAAPLAVASELARTLGVTAFLDALGIQKAPPLPPQLTSPPMIDPVVLAKEVGKIVLARQARLVEERKQELVKPSAPTLSDPDKKPVQKPTGSALQVQQWLPRMQVQYLASPGPSVHQVVQPQRVQSQHVQLQCVRTQYVPQFVQLQCVQPHYVQLQPVQPQSVQPQYVQPQPVQPQYVQPHNAQPQYVQPQPVQPQYVQSQYVQQQLVQPQYVQHQVMQSRIQ